MERLTTLFNFFCISFKYFFLIKNPVAMEIDIPTSGELMYIKWTEKLDTLKFSANSLDLYVTTT